MNTAKRHAYESTFTSELEKTMNKSYYNLGYSNENMNWDEVLIRSSSSIVYLDPVLDDIFSSNGDSASSKYYIITTEKVVNINIKYTGDSITFQDIENIIMSNQIVYIKGFFFLRRKKVLIEKMINCDCDNDFNEVSSKLGLDTWKYEFYHKKFLFTKMNKLINKNILNVVYDIKRDHPLIIFFMDFLRACFKMVNKRIFSIILIGDTKIGKSVCFKECLIDQKYIEYHNNMLEFSKCTDENKKVFRLMDDINWNTVDVMTLKSILNRNVATVDVKYSYGIIYPMINIFLMNKEDYAIFQRKYVDIWSFISNNVSIYPKQEKEIVEETQLLYDPTTKFSSYLFNEIVDLSQSEKNFQDMLERGESPNIYECIKSYLLDNQPYIYDNKQFIDLTSFDISLLPNRQLIENEMIRKIKEVETKERYLEKVENPTKTDNKSPKKANGRFNKKGCLDYYFSKHASKKKIDGNNMDIGEPADPNNALGYNNSSDTSLSDYDGVDEMDEDNDYDNDNDYDDDDDLMDDSFNC